MSPCFERFVPENSTRKVRNLKNLPKICLDLSKDGNALEELYSLLEEPEENIQQEKVVNHIHKRRKTGTKLHMNAQIGDYNMEFIILDLGSNVNIMTKKTWESMGIPKLLWFRVQFQLENKLKFIPFR